MSHLSLRRLRNGKLLRKGNANQTDILPHGSLASNMEIVNINVGERSRTRSPFPSFRYETQRLKMK